MRPGSSATSSRPLLAPDDAFNRKAWNEWIDKPELQPYLKEEPSIPPEEENAELELLMHQFELLGRLAGTRANRLLVKWARNFEQIEELGRQDARCECNQKDVEDVQKLLMQTLARRDQQYRFGPQTFERTELEELARRVNNSPLSSRQQAH